MTALQPHPLADLLPAMTEGEYAELRESIRANGQRELITLHRDGRVLDGRHRARACAELGRTVFGRTFDGPDSDLLAYVLDLNLKRRHLDESQRAMIAAELANLGEGRPGKTGSIDPVSLDRAATLLNVGRASVVRAKAVRASAIPAIVEAVRGGAMPVSLAARVAQLEAPGQERVAAEMRSGNGKSLATIVLAATRSERVEVIERAAQHVPLSALGRTFPVLYANPPWHQTRWSDGGLLKAPDLHYPTMPVAEICALPVAEIAARDAVLFMWALPNMLPEALEVVKAWGFTFCTSAVWVKPNIACGHWFRGKHEPLIVATRGNMPPPPDGLHASVFEGDRVSSHSGKPDFVRDWIASAYPHAGKLELFARTAAPGWRRWGNQAPHGNQLAEGD